MNDEQVELHKFLWNQHAKKDLIDYFDYLGWIKKTKEFSVKREIWPSDIIFLVDKSDKFLAEKLRNKCYEAAKWFPNKTLDDNHPDVKSLFEGVDKNFKFEDIKQLCSAGEDIKNKQDSKIKTVSQTTLSNLISGYSCSGNESNDPEMQEYYKLKKDEYSNSSFCDIVKNMTVSKIEYLNGIFKYEVWKSRKTGNGSFEIVPGTGNIYSSLEEIPGFLNLFSKK